MAYKFNPFTGNFDEVGSGSGSTINSSVISGATQGSVLFVGAASVISENNSNFFWDNTNIQLRVGASSSGFVASANTPLIVSGTTASFQQLYNTNQSTATTATTDIVAGADNDSTIIAGHYVDMGITSSTFVGTAAAAGNVKSVSVNAVGSGYLVNDVLTLTGGSNDATVTVLTVSGTTVTSVYVSSSGTGYSVANGLSTTGGTGSGCKINILTLYDLSLFAANDTYLWSSGGNLNIGTDDSVAGKSVKFFTGGTATTNERMRLTSTGLGIGLTAPSVLLNVQAASNVLVASFRTAADTGVSIYTTRLSLNPITVTSLNANYFSATQGTTGTTTSVILFGSGRGTTGSLVSDTYSPSTTINTPAVTFQSLFSPSAAAPNFVGVQINPTINGTSSGTATGLAVAVKNTALTGGTINLVDIGTTTTDFFTGYTSRFKMSIAGLFTVYNAIATVSNGIPSEVATIDSTGLTANVGASTLYAAPTSGMYRVSAYVVETTAGSISSTLPNVQVVYTDLDSNTAITIDVTPVLGVAGIGQTGALTANTVGTASSGVVAIYVKTSTTIQYQTVNYASNLAGMTYALRIKLEAL